MIFEITQETQKQLDSFVKERNWEKFHTEENLAKAIASETGELLHLYTWGPDWNKNIKKKQKIKELSDVLIFCFYYAKKLCISDINEIIKSKIKINTIKYPIKQKEIK